MQRDLCHRAALEHATSRPPSSTAGWARAVEKHPPPAVSGRRLKLRYMTQAKMRPPSFIIFASRPESVPTSYLRYLTNDMREAFDMPGTPIRIWLRAGKNPYADKRPIGADTSGDGASRSAISARVPMLMRARKA